jgi:hypothetical protein
MKNILSIKERIMFKQDHYVPILKCKKGELDALKGLPGEIFERFTPLLEIALPDRIDTDDTSPGELTSCFQKIAEDINKSCKAFPFFFDTWQIEDGLQADTGEHPVVWFQKKFNDLGMKAIPIVGIDRSQEYLSAFAEACKISNEVCIRMEVADFPLSPEEIPSLLGRCKVPFSKTHLIFDYEFINDSHYKLVRLAIDSLPQTLRNLDEYASYTIAGSSFPESMATVNQGVNFVPRIEWALYKEIIASPKHEGRKPTFGDYAINYVRPLEDFDPTTMTASANIRYTVEDDWMIVKGRSLKKGFEQFYDLAGIVIQQKQYCGPGYSEGDAMIDACAKRASSTGSQTTWRKIGTSHHITFVVRQIASSFGS